MIDNDKIVKEVRDEILRRFKFERTEDPISGDITFDLFCNDKDIGSVTIVRQHLIKAENSGKVLLEMVKRPLREFLDGI